MAKLGWDFHHAVSGGKSEIDSDVMKRMARRKASNGIRVV